jgi:hypothetical protein
MAKEQRCDLRTNEILKPPHPVALCKRPIRVLKKYIFARQVVIPAQAGI